MPVAGPPEVARHLADGGTTFVLHRHADADCVGAASALALAFGGRLWAPAGVSAAGARIARACRTTPEPEPGNPRRYLLVDVSAWGQVGEAAALVQGAPHGLLDHHDYGDEFAEAAFVLRDPSRAATCELALAVLEAAGRPPAGPAASALLAGILADSGRFRWGDADTLRAAARLVEAGAGMEGAHALLEEEEAEERSARIARLKAGQRARILAAGEHLIAVSRVGAHESAAAMGLVRLGADCALVAAPTAEGARVTARAAAGFPVHLGQTLHGLARQVAAATGGGHEASAGLRAPGAPEAWAARALAAVAERLGQEATELG